jgi:deoxyribonuclease IV
MSIYEEVSTVIWDVGAHTPFSKSIYNMLKLSIFYGMNTTQFFMGNPKSFRRHQVKEEDLEKSLNLCKRFPMNVFSHFPYISNLAGSVNQLAWEGDLLQDAKTTKVITSLEYELNVLAKFTGRSGVVIHPGNYKDRKVGISKIAETINKIMFTEGSKLILENSAGKGCSLATTFQEIKEIIDQVDDKKQKYIGVCVDTAHICGYGEYDLKLSKEVIRMFKDFDRIIGLDKFTLLHLNDSVVPLGSRKDQHACLGTGHIWSESFDSLVLLLDTCKKYNIPTVLETDILDMLKLGQISDSVTYLRRN